MKINSATSLITAILLALTLGCASNRIPEKFPDPNEEKEKLDPKGEKKQFSYYVDITDQLPKNMAEAVCKERVARRAMRYSTQKGAILLEDSFEVVPSKNGPGKVKCVVEARVWH